MDTLALAVLACIVLVAVRLVLRRPSRETGAQPRVHRPRPRPRRIAPGEEAPRVLSGKAWVTDGDGLRLSGYEIRLFGIDAPEGAHPHGPEAKQALIRLCSRKTVIAEVEHVDRFGRIAAICRLQDGLDLSAEMVRTGHALDWAKHSGGRYRPLEPEWARRKLWLADARQRGRTDIWRAYERRMEKRRARDAQEALADRPA